MRQVKAMTQSRLTESVRKGFSAEPAPAVEKLVARSAEREVLFSMPARLKSKLLDPAPRLENVAEFIEFGRRSKKEVS